MTCIFLLFGFRKFDVIHYVTSPQQFLILESSVTKCTMTECDHIILSKNGYLNQELSPLSPQEHQGIVQPHNIQLVDFREPNITNYMVDKVIVDETVSRIYYYFINNIICYIR